VTRKDATKRHHVAVDLDGTLAHYDGWRDGHIGEPVRDVQARVTELLRDGHEVTIFTARLDPEHGDRDFTISCIESWCLVHFGRILPATAIKRAVFTEFWDDRAVGIEKNEGRARLPDDRHAWSRL
jgi:hypothetical protein